MKQCSSCHSFLPDDKFFVREDRPALYEWCKNCCLEQGRSPDHPKLKYRNPGVFECETWRLYNMQVS